MTARIPQITALHTQISTLLRPLGRSPTRTEYVSALALADQALELATEDGTAGLDGSDDHMVQTCLTFQAFCLDPLRRACALTDKHEREKYGRASRAARQRRQGVLFNVDSGEHLFGAIEALNLENWLMRREESGDEEEPEGRWRSTGSGREKKKVRWLDEVSTAKVESAINREQVRLRDSKGDLTDPRQVPLLRKQNPQQFDGWKNVV
ncbi:hypothetical protein F5X99DRAFT_407866 [Biscogniauxia marginata]|nr:hypothetical protein F5X99DRAFT_407866 [Biscogniauxia marginata]